MFKCLVEEGVIGPMVGVRMKAVPDTKRLGGKYTPERCSLKATVVAGGATRAAKAAAVKEEDGDDEEEV